MTKVNLSSFQRKVFEVVLQIPVGQVRSYKWVARKIGKPNAHRAVASALGSNPFPVIVPCHRVIYSNGRIGGYRWGVKKKRELLERERKAVNTIKGGWYD